MVINYSAIVQECVISSVLDTAGMCMEGGVRVVGKRYSITAVPTTHYLLIRPRLNGMKNDTAKLISTFSDTHNMNQDMSTMYSG